MFKKMKVTSVRGTGFQVSEKPGSKMITAKEFAQIDSGRVVITGNLLDDKDQIIPERVQIIMQASQLAPVKAALFKKMERGEGLLEGTFTNLRDHDGDIEYNTKRIDIELTNTDGSAAFKFTPAVTPTWVDTKEFGECKVNPVIHEITQDKRDQGRDKLKDLINKRQRG